jgi:DHA1 family multidrug resistance protein-like MFS transporter
MMLLTFGVQAANMVASPMLPLFLKSLVRNISGEPAYIGSSTGIVLGVGAACAALAAVLTGKFSTRIGYWRTLIFCLSAGMVLTIPQAFVTNMFQLVVLRGMSSFFIFCTIPMISAIIAVSSHKEHQGTIYGVNASVSAAGNALGPLIGSAVAMLSLRAVFLATALILGLSAWEAIRRRKYS